MLNEAMNVVAALDFESIGEVVLLKEVLADGERALVVGHTDEEKVVRLAEPLRLEHLRVGESLLLEPRSGYVYERVPKSEVEELVLEEVPDIDYTQIGGLAAQIEMIRDAVELPYLHPDLFTEHKLRAAEGRPALRPARLRQDADRQGGRQLAGQEGRRGDRQARGPLVLPQHQGPRAAQQVRRRDRAAHPAGVLSGPARRPPRARRSSSSSTRWTRCSAPAGPASPPTSRTPSSRSCCQRDRRRRGPRERARHRRLQPRGHDRPGDPAAGPARREDQDRAAGRRVGARHLREVHHRGPAAARRRRQGERQQPRRHRARR